MLLPASWLRVLPRVRWRGPDSEPTIYLTFDDGPHREGTPRVLQALAAADAAATFFLTGALAREAPELVKRILSAGHAIGNHGAEHLAAGAIDARRYERHAVETQAILEDLAGAPVPRLFRPPYGQLTWTTYRLLRRQRFTIILWSLDSDDSDDAARPSLRAALAPERVRAGEVVLMHDDYPWTAEALPDAIARLQEQGYRFGRVDELAASIETGTPPEDLPLAGAATARSG